MNRKQLRMARYSFAGVLLAVLIGAVGARLHAQTFEYYYGTTGCNEAGRGGVRPVTIGGYIAAGETFGRVDDCSESDIYVVRTDDRGARLWEYFYDLGGNDSALDIIECENGEFVVTGVTENKLQADCETSREIFLLRLDRCGKVVAQQVLYRPGHDEIAFDVIEATTGDANYKTSAGDLLVAGSSTVNDEGRRDALLARFDANLNLIWCRIYDVQAAQGDDYFYGLDELTRSNPGDPNTSTSDIVACGGTDFDKTGVDALVVRVDGNDGQFNAAVHGVAVIRNKDRKEEEDLRQIQQYREGEDGEIGRIVVVGRTLTTSANAEVYLARLDPLPWILINDRTLGDNGDQADEGYYVREIRGTDAGLTTGNLIVTGYVSGPADLQKELFLQEYQPDLVPVGPQTRIFGGKNDDWGWSVSPVGEEVPYRTAGFVATGFSQSDLCGDGDPQDLYLIKTDASLNDNCNDRDLDEQDLEPKLSDDRTDAAVESIKETCKPVVNIVEVKEGCEICLDKQNTDQREFKPCDPAGRRAVPAPSLSEELSAAESYPNPVASGSPFSVRFSTADGRPVQLTVTDMAGRTVHTRSLTMRPGTWSVPVSTEGWAAGAYLVKVVGDGRSATARVVVAPR